MNIQTVVRCGKCEALHSFVGVRCPECAAKVEDQTVQTVPVDDKLAVNMRHQTAVRVLRTLLKEVDQMDTAETMRDMCMHRIMEIGNRVDPL